ncbi:MAG: chemotaxis protein histidine kinase CheA [Planctomycetota bacterium]|jgi:chemotaxis protein histidine kinase CheA
MEETNEAQADAPEDESQESNGRQAKTWYPYITKVQFEKFLARLESKVPEQIDRDYVRAIIRTPSMIYRFLRGIEAMKLIDRDQHPTVLLGRVVNSESRAFALAEVQRDLYKDLLEEQEKSGDMNDEEIVEYFRERTGMGRDSANKMKMFFKYLHGEADFSKPPAHVQAEVEAAPEAEAEAEAETKVEVAEEAKAEVAEKTKAEVVEKTKAEVVEKTKAEVVEKTKVKEEAAPVEAKPAPAPRPSGRERQERSRDNNQERNQERQERNQERSRDNRQQRTQEQPAAQASDSSSASSASYQERSPRPLTDQQKAYLDAVRSVVSINIDGDWDEDMIRVAFDRLERLLDRIRRM